MHEEDVLKLKVDMLLEFELEEIANCLRNVPNDIRINLYCNTDDWNQLKNIIVEWYKIKYPVGKLEMLSNKFKNKDKIIITPQDYDYAEVENLSNYMGYSDLMFRVPSNLHPLVECWYKGNLEGNFYLKDTKNKEEKYFKINEYDGSFIYLNKDFDYTLIMQNCPYIKDFTNIINKQYYDVSEMEKIILGHEINLELRKYFFEYIFYSIIDLSENSLIGNVRALKFMEEFNKYIYGLDLLNSEDDLNKRIIDKNMEEEIIFILDKLKNEVEDKSIEDFGLSFKTLKLLKSKKINKISDLNGKSPSNVLDDYGINNYNISRRDKSILLNMWKLAATFYTNKIEELRENEIEQKNNLVSATKQKKKSLFKKNK